MINGDPYRIPIANAEHVGRPFPVIDWQLSDPDTFARQAIEETIRQDPVFRDQVRHGDPRQVARCAISMRLPGDMTITATVHVPMEQAQAVLARAKL